MTRPDLSIIIVSTNEASWLERCLSTLFVHAGPLALDVIVVDNDSVDGTADLVRNRFSTARVVSCENHGFGHANNRGIMNSDARYVLLLNPDTEIVEGTFAGLVRAMDERPEVGLAGVKQLDSQGVLFPTIRRRPHPVRTLAEALGSERFPIRSRWLGERELDPATYDKEVDCDWTSGSFMLIRREALLSAGLLDERSFIYAEEPDLCGRIAESGWVIRHLPLMTIIHHAGKAGVSSKLLSQDAYARLLYARKHMSPLQAFAFRTALAIRVFIRALASSLRPERAAVRQANLAALRVICGRAGSPFEEPPATSLRSLDQRSTAAKWQANTVGSRPPFGGAVASPSAPLGGDASSGPDHDPTWLPGGPVERRAEVAP